MAEMVKRSRKWHSRSASCLRRGTTTARATISWALCEYDGYTKYGVFSGLCPLQAASARLSDAARGHAEAGREPDKIRKPI